MKRTVLAILILAAAGFSSHGAHAQPPGKATAEEFIQRMRDDLAGFIMVLPESTAAEGDWNFSVSITTQGKKSFDRSFAMAAVETPWTIPTADIMRAKSYRFELSQGVRDVINETDAALKDAIKKYGRGSGSLEISFSPPKGFLAKTRETICSSNRPLYFDLFFETDVLGRLARVEFVEPLRDHFGKMLKASCLPALPKPDANEAL